MPNYAYRCDCGHRYEEFKSLTAPWPAACPSCGAKWGKGFGQEFHEPNAIVRGLDNAKTFGQAAEENARRVGREKLGLMAEQDRARVRNSCWEQLDGVKVNTTGTGETPPWRDGSMGIPAMDKPLDLSSVGDPKKYIETGKT